MQEIIRPYRPEDWEKVVAVANTMRATDTTGWFTGEGIEEIGRDLKAHQTLVAGIGGEIVGFVTWVFKNERWHISWIGIRPDYHRRGIGRKLISEIVKELRKKGAAELYVDTLGESVVYEPYEGTRAFYRALGFRDFKRVFQPENESCPEMLVMVLNTADLYNKGGCN